MTKRLCVRPPQGKGSSPWFDFLPVQLRPLFKPSELASLSQVCHAFTKFFCVSELRSQDVGPLFGHTAPTPAGETAILTYDDGDFGDVGIIDWLNERARWTTMVKMLRDLDFIAERKPPPLFDQMPVLENLHSLELSNVQPWFFGPTWLDKMPNLVSLTLIVCTPIDELNFTGWPKLRRVYLENRSTAEVITRIAVDLPPSTRILEADATFFVRSGTENVEQLVLKGHDLPYVGKFRLSVPKWPALTQFFLRTETFAIAVSDGLLRITEFGYYVTEFGYDKTELAMYHSLHTLCEVERLKALSLAPGLSYKDQSSFPADRLRALEDLTLHLPQTENPNPVSLAPLVAVRKTLKRLVVWGNVAWGTELEGQWDLGSLRQLTRLESLFLGARQKPCNVALRHLDRCKELRHLTIRGMFLSLPKRGQLVLPKLETLELTNGSPQTAFLRFTNLVRDLPNSLKRLTLGCTIQGPRGASALMQKLRSFKRLEWLDLSGTMAPHRKRLCAELDAAVQLGWFSPSCTIVPCTKD